MNPAPRRRVLPGAANERWSMGFVHAKLADRTAFGALSLVDLFTLECVDLVPAVRLRADDVVPALNLPRDARNVPAVIQCDYGTKFSAAALDHWSCWC